MDCVWKSYYKVFIRILNYETCFLIIEYDSDINVIPVTRPFLINFPDIYSNKLYYNTVFILFSFIRKIAAAVKFAQTTRNNGTLKGSSSSCQTSGLLPQW